MRSELDKKIFDVILEAEKELKSSYSGYITRTISYLHEARISLLAEELGKKTVVPIHTAREEYMGKLIEKGLKYEGGEE